MLSKNKEAKKAAISKLAAKQRVSPVQKKKKGSTDDKSGKATHLLHARDVAIPEGTHAHSAGEELMKQLGDNINTRLQEISAQELADLDEDVDVFDEKKRELMEAARLAAGTRQRAAAAPMRAFLHEQESLTSVAQQKEGTGTTAIGTTRRASLQGLHAVRIGHNSNSITAVAALGLDVVVLGDKSGKVYLASLSPYHQGENRSPAVETAHRSHPPQSSSAAAAVAKHAYPPQHRKVLLFPVMATGVLSLAVSDTRDTFASMSARQLFEKTTVDTSCTSYIAAGCMDGSISIWETASREHKGLLWLHRQPVTSLHFRPATSTLLSVSTDHTLRVWSVPQMMAMDQLFGHEGSVFGCDSLRRNVCATVGDDGTMRYWKLDVATQQAYAYVKPPNSSIHVNSDGNADSLRSATPQSSSRSSLEAVAMLNESIIIAGSQDGSLVVFDINRRRPLMVQTAAHGYDFVGDGTGLEKVAVVMQQLQAEGEEGEEEEEAHASARSAQRYLGSHSGGVPPLPNPITALAAVPYADVFASASYDGVVRLWEVLGVGSGATPAGRRRGEEESEQQGEGKGKRPSSNAANSNHGPELRLLAEIPVPGLVNSLRFSWSGEALFVGIAKEPKGGRWVVQQSAMNSVYVIPLNAAGLSTLKAAGQIDHIPAQLFGLKDLVDDEEKSSDEEKEEGIEEEEEEEEDEEELAQNASFLPKRGGAGGKKMHKSSHEDEDLSDSDVSPERELNSSRLLQVDTDGAMILNQSLVKAAAKASGNQEKMKTKKSKSPWVPPSDTKEIGSDFNLPEKTTKKKKKDNKGVKKDKSGTTITGSKEQHTLAHSKVLKKKKKIMK